MTAHSNGESGELRSELDRVGRARSRGSVREVFGQGWQALI